MVKMVVGQGSIEMHDVNKANKTERLSKRIQSAKFTGVSRTNYNVSVRIII